MIKDGNWSNLGDKSLEKQAIQNTSAKVDEEQMLQHSVHSNNFHIVFSGDDIKQVNTQ